MTDPTRFALRDGMELAAVDLEELWWRYAALGGSGDRSWLALCVRDGSLCDEYEHDLIAQALNEAFIDAGLDTFPVGYRHGPSPSILPPRGKGAVPGPLEARREAAMARLHSAAAARRAAALHATAARLMQATGQLQFARHAELRARAARRRGAASAAA